MNRDILIQVVAELEKSSYKLLLTDREGGTPVSQWGVSFAATRKDVGSYPFRRGLTSQGSMNPGRAPRWSSAHCPRGVPAMKMTPLQASNLKQEDNLRPKKVGNTVNDTTEKGEHHVHIRPPKETTTTLSPGTLQHGSHHKGRVSRERGVDSEEQHTGCLGKISTDHPKGMPGGAFRYLPRKCRRYCQNVIPLVLWKRMA
ncbi:hypothetical protein GEV33_001866 [Tenebrio molitor]|uniref:Uncharacterized protein n=1 Tax=Tenebrio molitor TaxID=7067 RepID=A0A8J6LGH5_TENMO|nr:hypothetical protein GEV33_001866 [Tenebrio molitor]